MTKRNIHKKNQAPWLNRYTHLLDTVTNICTHCRDLLPIGSFTPQSIWKHYSFIPYPSRCAHCNLQLLIRVNVSAVRAISLLVGGCILVLQTSRIETSRRFDFHQKHSDVNTWSTSKPCFKTLFILTILRSWSHQTILYRATSLLGLPCLGHTYIHQ